MSEKKTTKKVVHKKHGHKVTPKHVEKHVKKKSHAHAAKGGHAHGKASAKKEVKSKSKPKCKVCIGTIAAVTIALLLIILLIITLPKAGSEAEAEISGLKLEFNVVDGVVGVDTVVTDDVIEIDENTIDYLAELFASNGYETTFEQVINESVVREILYYNVDKSKIDEAYVDSILASEQFRQRILDTGNSPDEYIEKYREEMLKDYAVQLFFNEEVMKVVPTNEGRETSHILICYEGAQLCSKNRTKAAARNLAMEILVRAEEENDVEMFGSLAEKYSDGPSAANKGFLGVVTKGQMVPEFEAATFELEAGNVYDALVETQFGFHIIRVEKAVPVPDQNGAVEVLYTLKDEIMNNVNFVKEFEMP